ncbi:hypothetical protein RSSM_03250 [Rhodopirellula sallentina SM41]|uniref:Uncharacterized protein n=1 Tax=Rhodopirellula sallentina SM41 TaxID=1263870 RepID=M5UH07_9BACT|nr:hypothetical protein RSSM_03250 [Rhodopirellula sallentina SM41]
MSRATRTKMSEWEDGLIAFEFLQRLMFCPYVLLKRTPVRSRFSSTYILVGRQTSLRFQSSAGKNANQHD